MSIFELSAGPAGSRRRCETAIPAWKRYTFCLQLLPMQYIACTRARCCPSRLLSSRISLPSLL